MSADAAADLMRRADIGYMHDPEFHAKVEMTVGLVTHQMGTATLAQMGIARTAAALALALTIDDLNGPSIP